MTMTVILAGEHRRAPAPTGSIFRADTISRTLPGACASLVVPFVCWSLAAAADDAAPQPPATTGNSSPEQWAIHGQATYTQQLQPGFRSPFAGPQSLPADANGRETFDATVYLGYRPWQGAEIWLNPEADQGFGLGNSFGVAGYLSGEAYKLGQNDPYYRMARAFFRQTIDLGGEPQKLDPDLNQLGGTQTANRIVLTIGKLSVVDIFDTNKYAHDPREDFLNWAILDVGAFDYAADAWGTTYGAAAEWYQDRYAARVGLFDLSNVPNSISLSLPLLHQTQFVAELEERHMLGGEPGKIKVLYLAVARQPRHLLGCARAGGGNRHDAIDPGSRQLPKQIWHGLQPGAADCRRPWHVR